VPTPTIVELRELFQSKQPRRVPGHVLQRAQKVFSAPKSVVTIGAGLCIVGLCFLAVLPFRSSLPNAGQLSGPTGPLVAVAILFPLVGVPLAFSTWRRRNQVATLLERGRLVSGTVLSAKRSKGRTRTRSGGRVRSNLRQTRITVAIDGESGQARFTTYKKSAAKLARFAMERKLPIVFLVAPEAPNATLAPAMMVASHHIGLAVETETLDSITLLAHAPMS
jgi:hypothetical protein